MVLSFGIVDFCRFLTVSLILLSTIVLTDNLKTAFILDWIVLSVYGGQPVEPDVITLANFILSTKRISIVYCTVYTGSSLVALDLDLVVR